MNSAKFNDLWLGIIMRKIRKIVYVTFIKIRRNIYIPGRNIILNAIRIKLLG